MVIEITGRVVHIGELKENGQYKSRPVVLQYESFSDGKRFENNAVLNVQNGACDVVATLSIGQTVTAKFNITGREWNGKWFGENKCFYLKK
jgi:hypothetical protein